MHKSWRFIPSLAATFGVIAVLVLSSGAWAQDQAGTGPGAAKRYVLMSASGTWGAAQTATINRLGATVASATRRADSALPCRPIPTFSGPR